MEKKFKKLADLFPITLDEFKGFVGRLGEFYHEDAVFQDPLVRVEGLEAMKSYFERSMIRPLRSLEFELDQLAEEKDLLMIKWTMRIRTKVIPASLSLEGVSVIRYEGERIISHRDFWDRADLLEGLPGAGRALKKLKAFAAGILA